MATVTDIFLYLDQKAPFQRQMSFDNAGFLVGRGAATVTKILVALDITEAVIAEAVALGAELIVSHHPVLFHPAKHITDADATGRKLLALTEHGIAAICCHTNLDVAAEGVNDALAQALGLTACTLLETAGTDQAGTAYGLGRIGVLPQGATMPLVAFGRLVKDALGANGLRYVDAARPVRRVAVGGGACGDYLGAVAAAGCDTFVTSDVKYDVFLEAKAMGINLIDAGHYPTENVVCPVLVRWLHAGFPALACAVSQCHCEVFSYL